MFVELVAAFQYNKWNAIRTSLYICRRFFLFLLWRRLATLCRFLERFQQVAGDFHHGATEYVDFHYEVGAAVGFAEHVAFEAHQFPAVDADAFAEAQGARADADGRIGAVHHAHQAGHLAVGDDGDGAMPVDGCACCVDEEATDVGDIGLVFQAFTFGASHDYECGEDDAAHFRAAAVAPCAHFLLDGDVCLAVFSLPPPFFEEFPHPFAAHFFGVVADDGDVPMFGGLVRSG